MHGMNKTNNIHNKNKIIVASIAIVFALALITSPIMAMDNDAFATKKKKGNVAQQAIEQSQASVQNALCVSGSGTFVSCNNLSFQNQKNTGNNALAQQGVSGSGKGSGNSAEQSISQSQSSNQNSQIVSGGDTIGSGNNINVQNQENSGNNALAQQGGNGKGSGNSAEQSISQSQSSEQNSQVVSGGDTIGSGNNVNVQSQTNSGSNAAAQS
jgi:hypothetical protein